MNKKTYYILNFTWGIIMTLIGGVVALWLICRYKLKPTRHGGCLQFTFRKNWGGVSLGLVTIVQEGATDHTKDHEFGHSIQNALYGPFQVILSLASATRYHYRNRVIKSRPGKTLPPYDAFWFEAQATKWGEENMTSGVWT